MKLTREYSQPALPSMKGVRGYPLIMEAARPTTRPWRVPEAVASLLTLTVRNPRYASLIIAGQRQTAEKMPSSAKQSPPKTCPVCGQSIWKKWDNLPTSPWQRYISHIQSSHPDFAKWSRRSGLTYFLALIPFFAFAISSTMATSASEASILAILMFPAGFAVIPIVWMYHHRIKTGFRRSWTQQHGSPLIAQRTPNSTN